MENWVDKLDIELLCICGESRDAQKSAVNIQSITSVANFHSNIKRNLFYYILHTFYSMYF